MKIFKISKTQIFPVKKVYAIGGIPTFAKWIQTPSVQKELIKTSISIEVIKALSLMFLWNESSDHKTGAFNLIKNLKTDGVMTFYQMIKDAVLKGDPPYLLTLEDIVKNEPGSPPSPVLPSLPILPHLKKIFLEYEHIYGKVVDTNKKPIIKKFYQYLNDKFKVEIADCANKLTPPNTQLSDLVNNFGLFYPDKMMKVTNFMPHHNYIVQQYKDLAEELTEDFTEKTSDIEFEAKKNIMWNKITSNRGMTQNPTTDIDPSKPPPDLTKINKQTNPQSATNPTGTTECSILLAPTVISGISCVLLELLKMSK